MTKEELLNLIKTSETNTSEDEFISEEERLQMDVEGALSQIAESDINLYDRFTEFAAKYDDAYDNFNTLEKFAETL